MSFAPRGNRGMLGSRNAIARAVGWIARGKIGGIKLIEKLDCRQRVRAEKIEEMSRSADGSGFFRGDAAESEVMQLEGKQGRIAGTHEGFARFTVGQRRRLPGGSSEPMFVVALRPADRAVVIGPREALLGRGLLAREVNWLVAEAPVAGASVQVRIRHRARPVPGTVLRTSPGEIEVTLDEAVYAITPGQSVVFYDGDVVLGGGVIDLGRRALPVRAA